jgi:ADP-ribose pyrophosphatase
VGIPLIRHPDSVVLVVVEGSELVVVRQTRPGAPEPTLELPTGKLEPGETPEQAARRELAEECGLAAKSFERLGSFWVVPAYSTERTHVFRVTGLSPAPPAALDEDEDIEVARVPLDDPWTQLSDAASIAAFALWRRATPPAR